MLAAVGSAFLTLPYFVLSPGAARPTSDLIHVSGARTYHSDGHISYMTVSLERATALTAAMGWLDSSVAVVPEKDILGDQSPKQNEKQNLADMADSKQVATAVALETLGYDVIKGTGAQLLYVDPKGPAHAALKPGDTITTVGDKRIQSFADLVRVLGSRRPGDTVRLGVDRFAGGKDEVSVTLGARSKKQPNSPFLGIAGHTRATIGQLPVQVTIDTGDVGGPSAGLAFTLSVLDALTPQDLTGGKRVATTGTMDLDGTVGLVGGVPQKTVAARRAGTQLFIVPSGEYKEAKRYAGKMDVEKADTIEQALKVLHDRVGADTESLSRHAEAALG